MKPRLCVLGSINMDLLIRCNTLPGPGETKSAIESTNVPGGKGANQAVAAARLGAEVSMIGRVGDDPFADTLLENLWKNEIDVRHVQGTGDCSSGYAVVAVDDSGENQIIVVPGANGRVGESDVEAARRVIANSDMLLVQLEVPLKTVAAAIRIANEVGTPTMLDPAPSPAIWLGEFNTVDFLCPNESEASAITGLAIHSVADATNAAHALQKQTDGTVIVTLGDAGAIVCNSEATHYMPSFPVVTTDSTAAGDTFAGAFATHFCQHHKIADAVQFANAAAAIACTKHGAQTGMPSCDEVTAFIEKRDVTPR